MNTTDANKEHQESQQGSPSRQESIKLISEILRRTNQLIQKGDWDKAQGELLSANRAAKEQFRKTLYPTPAEEKLTAPSLPVPPLPLAPMDAMMAAISSKQTEPIPPAVQQQHTSRPEKQQTDPSVDRSIELKCYRDALEKAWSDGIPTQDEERHLEELRTVLEIIAHEHETIQEEVKTACYRDALSRHISEGRINLSDTQALVDLQRTYQISQSEHTHVLHFFKQPDQQKNRDKILIIDDDTQFLEMLAMSMEDDGFDVAAVSTSDEAYTLLRKYRPDLILCDINLKTSSMNGFTLYEKIQSDTQLQHIPFVFLTGLTDEKIACTGKELGADDYLTKPISRHSLLSSLHGKLKRFKQLKNFPGGTTPIFC